MKKLALIALPLALAACGGEAPSGAPEGGPPPPPPYQLRAELPEGNRLAASNEGETLYSNRCGTCHLAGGMGTNLLTVQQMKAGNSPEMGLLTNRTDLTVDYVKAVVRNGKVAMPPLSRVEATDAELDAIAAFLAKDKL
ncbi:c-type cytochrome [Parerythrobacter aestuarii]|uniref:c-type cytochrome n=1 Tax=Parerythrobacter aestuarii TaxID=3020909 RepID=UPI0024DEA21B|nr:cytochrome c [Parerythrobacter aestuarii]